MILLAISNGWKTAIMIVAMIAVFYIFLIRPQSQEAKKEAAYRNSLKPGDQLMTSGGLHVTFVSIEGSQAVVEPAPGHRSRSPRPASSPSPSAKPRSASPRPGCSRAD